MDKDINYDFEQIVFLDNLENQFNNPVLPFFNTSEVIKYNIEIVNITATSNIDDNIFFKEDIDELTLSIKKIEEPKSDIEKYSKIITLKKDEILSGRLFKSGKIMIYAKNIEVDNPIKMLIDEINKIYKCNLKIIDTCLCLICQFQLGFNVDYIHLFKILQKNPKLNSGDFIIDVFNLKIKKGYHLIFYILAENKYKFSFTIFSTGKIQARCNGNKNICEILFQYCEYIFNSLHLIRDNIETTIIKKKHKKKINYNLTRKSSNIQLFCFGLSPNSKGILSSSHFAFSKTNLP